MFIKLSLFPNQHLRQSLPLLVALAISLNISSCGCNVKDQSSGPSDGETTVSQPEKKEATNPINVALTSRNGTRLIGDTPLVLIIKNTGKQPIAKGLKLKVIRTCTTESCVAHEVLLSKPMPVGEQITEKVTITPGMSKKITFTCQIIHQEGGQEKFVCEPLIVEWEGGDPTLEYDIAYDKHTGDMLCTISKESTESIQGIELHYMSKTSGVQFNGKLLNQEQVIVIGGLQAGDKSVTKRLGNLDLGSNQCAEFDFWLTYTDGPSEHVKKSVVFTAIDICLKITELYYDLEKNSIVYNIQNSGQDITQDIKLHYMNMSRDGVGSTVLIGNEKEGTINLGSISGGGSVSGELAVEVKSASKFKIALEVICKDMVLDSLCIEVILPKLKLAPTASDFLLGVNKTIQFKIEEENNISIDLSELNILINKLEGDGVKIFYQDEEIKKVLLGTKLGYLDNPVHLTMQPGAATKASIEVQLVYYNKVVANQTFTWQDDIGQATKELFEAVDRGDVARINQLLNGKKAQINATDNHGETLLWKASLNNNREAVLALLKASDIHVNDRNNNSGNCLYGYTSLQWYVQKGDKDIVAALLNKGADINDKVNDQIGHTVLHIAISNRDQEMLDLLLKDPRINPNVTDKSGASPLHLAISTGNQEAIDKLLQKEADVNAVDNFGRTPLHMLVTSKGSQETIDKLLRKGADVNAVDNFGNTPLDMAIQKRDVAIVKQLITAPTKLGKDIHTPLDIVVKQKGIETIEKLVLLIGVNFQDSLGNTLLHYAVRQKNETIAGLLVEKGADLDLKNKQQESSRDWYMKHHASQ